MEAWGESSSARQESSWQHEYKPTTPSKSKMSRGIGGGGGGAEGSVFSGRANQARTLIATVVFFFLIYRIRTVPGRPPSRFQSTPPSHLEAGGGGDANSSTWIDDVGDRLPEWWVRRPGPDAPLRYPSPRRLVAIGDVHGDLKALRRALRVAGAVNANGRWIGRDLTVVQLGDNLDRGTDELAVIYLLQRLKLEAEAEGGTVHAMLGNHEMQNCAGDFGSVAGSLDFDTIITNATKLGAAKKTGLERTPQAMQGLSGLGARTAALALGGPLTGGILSERNVISIFGRTLFVHGGLLPRHAQSLERINWLTRQWLRGNTTTEHDREILPLLFLPDSVLWARVYSTDVDEAQCVELRSTLAEIGVDRMVVGHTPQPHGITSACGDAVWRTDTGMSAWFAGFTAREVQVLEITNGDKVRVLTESNVHLTGSDIADFRRRKS